MSRIRENYKESKSYRFWHFLEGDEQKQEKDVEAEGIPIIKEARIQEKLDNERFKSMNFVELKENDPEKDAKMFAERFGFRIFRKIYNVCAVILCLAIISMMIVNVLYMPVFGSTDTPTNNEVSERYLEKGTEEFGVVNLVTSLILQYRAFDTFGETNVLFIATCTVMALLMGKKHEQNRKGETSSKEEDNDRRYELGGDMILQMTARILVPIILVFGFYILLNGHLSPGGGFSGGAIMGAGLILYTAAFGFTKTARFFNEKVYEIIKVGSLALYACIISYYLFTGANQIASIVPLGKVGAILSSGLILPINILVGLEVACTMYAFYAFFRKGGF